MPTPLLLSRETLHIHNAGSAPAWTAGGGRSPGRRTWQVHGPLEGNDDTQRTIHHTGRVAPAPAWLTAQLLYAISSSALPSSSVLKSPLWPSPPPISAFCLVSLSQSKKGGNRPKASCALTWFWFISSTPSKQGRMDSAGRLPPDSEQVTSLSAQRQVQGPRAHSSAVCLGRVTT